MGCGLFVVDKEGRIILTNDTACEILGYSKEELIGLRYHELFSSPSENLEKSHFLKAQEKFLPCRGEASLKRKNGTLIEVDISIRPIYSYENSEFIVIFHDITERKHFEKELYRLSTTDALTGLYNRRFATEIFIKLKDHADRYKTPLSILMIDIDKFKVINDTYGHEKGDEVLIRLAKLLREIVRASDFIVRWGGEEFLVILPNTDLLGASVAAEKIRAQVENLKVPPIERITVSIGVASYK